VLEVFPPPLKCLIGLSFRGARKRAGALADIVLSAVHPVLREDGQVLSALPQMQDARTAIAPALGTIGADTRPWSQRGENSAQVGRGGRRAPYAGHRHRRGLFGLVSRGLAA
jgi:hypothetical protein